MYKTPWYFTSINYTQQFVVSRQHSTCMPIFDTAWFNRKSKINNWIFSTSNVLLILIIEKVFMLNSVFMRHWLSWPGKLQHQQRGSMIINLDEICKRFIYDGLQDGKYLLCTVYVFLLGFSTVMFCKQNEINSVIALKFLWISFPWIG